MTRPDKGARAALTRRSLLKASAGLAVGAGLAAPYVRRAAAADDFVVVNSWGGSWLEAARKNFFDPFTEATGIRVETVSPVSFAKLVAQSQTGAYDFDVTTLGGAALYQAQEAGVLAPTEGNFDASQVPEGNVMFNGVASHAYSFNVTYRNDTFADGKGPQSWAEFWDTAAFPGPRTLPVYPSETIAFALLADGVAPEELYPMDLDRAFASLDRLKPDLRVFWQSGAQAIQLIQDREVAAGGLWASGARTLEDNGVPVTLVRNQALVDRAFWCVSKGTPRAENAWKYIQFATQPEPMAGFCRDNNMGPMDERAFELIDAEVARTMPTHPDNIAVSVWQDVEDVGSRLTEMTKRFERWMAS
ncbi:ABC transporter substrate-binding protein [Aquibium sp. A9E412]|uniref:ABC transporter substrate-binding protein n=1 Tax=Aquibium sp. A9E412 TaxID=2976767 RepID=UPI0025B1BED4|nr:ABC transporter substrate-binding protein [Aquibium sp. A9E412]MDN2565057.1 ABC transporter substrate-binding protein [Aquibium sp. A9E412]